MLPDDVFEGLSFDNGDVEEALELIRELDHAQSRAMLATVLINVCLEYDVSPADCMRDLMDNTGVSPEPTKVIDLSWTLKGPWHK